MMRGGFSFMDEVERFKGQCRDLPRAFTWGCVDVLPFHGRHLELCLRLNAGATIDAIRNDWWKVAEWQQELAKFQGPWTGGGDGELYETLSSLQTGGRSYARLAGWLNERIVELLQEHVAYTHHFERDWSRAARAFKTQLDAFLWHVEWCEKHDHNPYQYGRTSRLLAAMGLPQEDITCWCDALTCELERIAKLERQAVIGPDEAERKRKRLARDGPITRDPVISRVRAWRKVVKTG